MTKASWSFSFAIRCWHSSSVVDAITVWSMPANHRIVASSSASNWSMRASTSTLRGSWSPLAGAIARAKPDPNPT